FFSLQGGLKAVVWTDVFQVGIMIAGFASIIIRSVLIQGGIGNILNDAYHGGRLNFWEFDPNPLRRHTFWTFIFGGTFTWISIYGVNQSQVQRYLSCKTRLQAKLSLYVNLLGLWIILSSAVFSGLCIYSIYKDCDPWTAGAVSAPDQIVPYLVLDILRDFPGVPGLFVASAYSGTLSTVSSSINALATVTIEDLIKPHTPASSERTLSWLSKGMSLLYGILCIGMAALASQMESLIQGALSLFGIIGGPLLGLFSLGILFPCANSTGGIVGLLSGFAFSLWVGIGAQVYPPLPERTLPLSLSIAGCNISTSVMETNWTAVTETMHVTNQSQTDVNNRPELADTLYSLSYLYFSTIGTLTVLAVGLVVSLLTGGKKQDLNPELLLRKEDFFFYTFISSHANNKKDGTVEVLNWKPLSYPMNGIENAAFNHAEMNITEQEEKLKVTHI
uniref:Solute carrier family 5 member 8 n=1 Tax=Latimeria chalumnae TaxID=7897 RepID=H3AVC3_LATCH